MDDSLAHPAGTLRRAELHAALADPSRLAIVDELAASDRSPSELSRRFSLPTNLLAHHLSILERVGLVERTVSSGDRRRRYVRLRHDRLEDLTNLEDLTIGAEPLASQRSALFVCTHNSARSQLAAALWRSLTGGPATSAGTHPAPHVHPGAVEAAARRGLDISGGRPCSLEPSHLTAADLVVSVCDRAHEEIELPADALHWSIPDPVGDHRPDAFDRTAELLERRITWLPAQQPRAAVPAVIPAVIPAVRSPRPQEQP